MDIQVIELDHCSSLNKKGAKHTYLLDAEDTNRTSLWEHINIEPARESELQAHPTPTTIYVKTGMMTLFYGINQTKIPADGSAHLPPNVIYKMVNEEAENLVAIVVHNLLGRERAKSRKASNIFSDVQPMY